MMTDMTPARRSRTGRIILWGGLAALLALPALMMFLTAEVRWQPETFLLFGAMLGCAGLAWEFLASRSGSLAYRLGAGLSVVMAFLLVWSNLAVGWIGGEGESANILYLTIPLILACGAVMTRFHASAMARLLLCVAGIQIAIATAAVLGDWGAGDRHWPAPLIGATAMFAILWSVAAALFWVADSHARRR